MAGIDFGAAFNTFVGLQQRQAEETRQERNDAFELEAAKLKLQLLAQEDTRQERDLKLRETEGQQQGEKFKLDQQRRTIENQILSASVPFAEMQDDLNMAESLAIAQQKERAFRKAGQTKSADLLQGVIQRAEARRAQMGAQGETGGTTPASQEGAPSGKAAGSEPPVVEPTQAGSSSPQAMVMDPPRQSEDFYKRVREAKSGDRFKSAEGTEFQVVDSPEQVQADQLQRQRWTQTFGKDVPFPNSASLVSKKDMEIEEGKFKAAARTQRMQEVAGKAQEELLNVVDQQNQLNQTLKDAKSGSRIMATPEGVSIQGFSIDNLARERAALERLQESGQLTRPVLEAYNQAFGQAFEDKLSKDPQLAASVTRAGPTDFRINLDADPRTSPILNDAMRMSESFEQAGLPPNVILRRSTPKELVQDFERGMPQGSQMRAMSDYEATTRGALGDFASRVPRPLDNESLSEVQGRLSKLTAAMGRSLFDLPPEQREAAKAEALNQLKGMQGNYYIGQSDGSEGGRINAINPQGLSPRAPSGPFVQMRERLKQLESILKPKAGAQSQGNGPVSAGASPGMPGASAINLAVGAAALGSAENVQAANKAFGTVTQKTKDKAANAVTDVKREYVSMTDAEKTKTQNAWKAKRGTWKNWGVKEATLKEMNLAVGLDRNDGF